MNTKTDRRPSDSPPAHGSAPRLRVMTKDIMGAKRNDWDNCPIARAAKRVWPGADVQVFNQHIFVNGYQVSHTDDTREFSSAWDEGPVRPATLEIPEEMVERLSVQSEKSSE